MDYTVYAAPLFILAIAIELVYGLRVGRNTYRVNDAVGSLFLGVLSQARKFVTLGIGGYAYYLVTEYVSLPLMDPGHWWTWVLAMVLYDFCYYWLHRIGHERSILWAAHVAHHQSEDYNLSTALRQTSTGFLLGWVFYIPMFMLGIPAAVVVSVGSLNLIYQFWVHTEHVPKLGWYEWIFVTPSNHRVHHAQNERYMDRNYGGLFILWDRLFGTFQEELDEEPPVYGIRGALHSFNPIKALTHIYADMVQDSVHTASWKDKARVWVARTGWRPADVAERYPRQKTDLAHFERYDPQVSPIARAYALFQLVAIVGLLFVLQSGAATSYSAGALLAVFMLLTAACTAMWLDARRADLCVFAELGRMLLLLMMLWSGAPLLTLDVFPLVAGAYLVVNLLWLVPLARSADSAVEAGSRFA